MAELDALRSDLAAEQRALDDIVSALSDEQWGLATSSPGWDVTDQVGHLTYFDGTAAMAITDPRVSRPVWPPSSTPRPRSDLTSSRSGLPGAHVRRQAPGMARQPPAARRRVGDLAEDTR